MRCEHINLKEMFADIPRNGYLTHKFDPYPAKMIPQMARFMINQVSIPGDTILDNFCGSASVLIESRLSGRNSIGVDYNPLAIILAKSKTTAYDIEILKTQLNELLNNFMNCNKPYQYDFTNADYWFTQATLKKLGIIKTVLDDFFDQIDYEYAFFWKAMAATIVRECSRADLRGSKPFISKKARKTRVGKHFNPFTIFKAKACLWIGLEEQYVNRLKEIGGETTVKLLEADSRYLSTIIKKKSINAVVTSPPYLSAQDYYRASKLQLFIFGGYTPKNLLEWSRDVVGSDRIHYDEKIILDKLPSLLGEKIKKALMKKDLKKACVFSKYVLDMQTILQESKKVLIDSGTCCMALGKNLSSNIVVPTPKIISELAENEGFELKKVYCDKIKDRWVPTIRNGHNGIINDEYIMIFQ